MKTSALVILAIVSVLFAPPQAEMEITINGIPVFAGRSALKDLKRVNVFVTVDEHAIAAFPNLGTSLKTLIELRLRREGIDVAQSTEAGGATLFLDVHLLELKKAGGETLVYAVSYEFYLSEPTCVLRNNAYVSADTWKQGGLLSEPNPNNLIERLRPMCERALDRLMNDFYAANPRTPQAKSTNPLPMVPAAPGRQ